MIRLLRLSPAAILLIISAFIMIAAAALVYAAISPEGSYGSQDSVSSVSADIKAQAPESFQFREGIKAEDAAAINAKVPDSDEALEMALPLTILKSNAQNPASMLAIDCLTSAIYYEAASESLTGQRAVAQVVLNRMRHPAYPNSVCGVVYQGSQRRTGCQFSFTCDGSLSRRPSAASWARARVVAAMALSGYVEPSVGMATHYHTIWVVPYWSSSLTKLRTVGAHIFYRWSGNNGKRGAFTNRYASVEKLPDGLMPTPLSDLALEALPVSPTANPVNNAENNSAAAMPADFSQTGLLAKKGIRLGEADKAADQQLSKQSDKNLIANDGDRKIEKDVAGVLKVDRQ
jgi:spore germination cell wall hydrolase CwlJ-like protein